VQHFIIFPYLDFCGRCSCDGALFFNEEDYFFPIIPGVEAYQVYHLHTPGRGCHYHRHPHDIDYERPTKHNRRGEAYVREKEEEEEEEDDDD